ncbi:MAG: DUF438 domain-containing protein [Halobacteriales archaeon]|jgi:DUF438 domain-containing protein
MSEFIDNVEQSPRVSELYEFVTRVHEGDDTDGITPEYEDAIEAVRPYDVLVIEDTLLNEGVSIQGVKEEIEPILEVLRPALEAHEWDRPDSGHPIDNMLRENRAIESHLSEISRLIDDIESADRPPLAAVGDLQTHIEALEEIDRHFVRKENELFPYLEDHWKHDRPLDVMWSIHDDIRSHRKTIETMVSNSEVDPETLSNLCDQCSTMLRGLIFKEERIIFPVAMSTLTDDEWRTIQQESAEIGYFEIEPEFAYLESTSTETDNDVASSPQSKGAGDLPAGAVELGLETGTLSLNEIELLFDSLPVDVTYVDENDRVRYFNNPEDRIFPRSGSIIGRTVQNCHPPESVDKVEEILSAFRSGTKDRARFWIQNDDAFVVIEYFALRDGSGRYRGTLEVTREVSDIRELEGEQRLVNWEE